ncbi:hypothetical protein Cgig2_000591 [Carnegiea gigantea]|uniref:Uncharacterized protein n=1 Tax=Carnegiea gigantea TaxID=171969 RepID=A0A9Q1GPP5_9CARY|nr:hypothetical protein Cgig2_000591 [Carnegiea gigantea]
MVASFCVDKKVLDLCDKKCKAPVKKWSLYDLISLGFGFSLLALHYTNTFSYYIGALLIHHGKGTFVEVSKKRISGSVYFKSRSQLDLLKIYHKVVKKMQILDSKASIGSSSNEGVTLETVNGDIKFSYTIALVRESGSGTFTVIHIIKRFYELDKD